MSTIIEIENISKQYKKQTILDKISLTIKEGFCYGFVGYNGSGKSMLFKAICGFIQVNSGTIKVFDKLIGKDMDFISDTGVLIETPDFFSYMTAFENLKLLSNIKKVITDSDIINTLDEVGLKEQKDKKVGKFSQGMKQRLRIAQAIMEDPKILILDEPFNALDKKGVQDIQNLLIEYKKKGKTVLLTSHNSIDIKLLCDIIFEMDKGKIIGTLDKEDL